MVSGLLVCLIKFAVSSAAFWVSGRLTEFWWLLAIVVVLVWVLWVVLP